MMQVKSRLSVKKSMARTTLHRKPYEQNAVDALLKEWPSAVNIKTNAESRDADEDCGEGYWLIEASGEIE